MTGSIKEKITSHFKDLAQTKQSPKAIAAGFSLGTLIAILPTPGIGIVIGVLLTVLFRKINKYSLFVALAVWNPFVLAPIYTLSYHLGNSILAHQAAVEIELSLAQSIYHYSLRFIVGNIILAIIIAAISYMIVFFIARKIKKNKEKN